METLKEGEVICNKCVGIGVDKILTISKTTIKIKCNKCLGVGKLDWLENLLGKVIPIPWFHGQGQDRYVDWKEYMKNGIRRR